MISRSRNPLLTFLLSYHVWVTSKIQVNFRYRRYSKVLMILSYKFLKFLQYSCFRGQEIHCWYSYWATMFGWLRKSRSTSGTEGTDDCVLWIFEISSLFMFSRVRNPFLIFLLSYLVWMTSKIQVNFRYRRYSEVLMIVSYTFLTFLHYLCFRGQATEFWHFYRATTFGWPQNFRSTSGSGGTDDSVLWIFEISLLFRFSRSRNPLLIWPTELPRLGDLKNLGQLPVLEVLRSAEQGSSVGMSTMDSLTSKTWILKKFQKFIRQNHQYLLYRKLTWIFRDTRA